MVVYPVPEVIAKINVLPKVTDVILSKDFSVPFVYGDTYDPIKDEVVLLAISFDATDKELWISVKGECCETNWFGFPSDPKVALVGKTITNIYEKAVGEPKTPFGKDKTKDNNGNNECDQQYSVTISFSDGTKYKFHRNNAFNGYYSGKLKLNLCKGGKPLD